jgi:hypothetical protein
MAAAADNRGDEAQAKRHRDRAAEIAAMGWGCR